MQTTKDVEKELAAQPQQEKTLELEKNLSADYSKIDKEDNADLEKWLSIKNEITALAQMPNSRVSERKTRAAAISLKLLPLGSFFQKYPFLFAEYWQISQSLFQYINAQLQAIDECARKYFQDYFTKENKEIKNIQFFPKKGGDQLGRRMVIQYLDTATKEQREICYHIKTHQYGSRGGQGNRKPVDPKELFIYKVLEYTGMGTKAHFFFNFLSTRPSTSTWWR